MLKFTRSEENPVLVPLSDHPWESSGAFNGSPVSDGKHVHLVYRALSSTMNHHGVAMQLSTVGYAKSRDGIHFTGRRQLISPKESWEQYGCEDPRITKLGGKFYIFYTGLGGYPFGAENIKIALAVTKDFKKFEKRRLITPFNAKAMALFPEKIDGKFTAILTANTDRPPARIAIASFKREEDMWSPVLWNAWYKNLDAHVLSLHRSPADHVELGAPPIKTAHGWLVFYSHIQNYFSPPPVFGIEAVLLDLKNPLKIVGRTFEPLMVPQEVYERFGQVPNIVFPSGVLQGRDTLKLYYGATDTTCAMASCKMSDLLNELVANRHRVIRLSRFSGNPIIVPDANHAWESKATFNPAAVRAEGRTHILYRAMSEDNTSVIGYASSADGLTITERLRDPAYVPQAPFEAKGVPGGNSGCEDPRMTRIGDTLYMCYTAYTGQDVPRVALTTISLADFVQHKWNWTAPQLISPPGVDDKDAALFPRRIMGKYVLLHRPEHVNIWIDFVDDLDFGEGKKWLGGKLLMTPRSGDRDSARIGISGPPIELKEGWLLLYHGISKKSDHHYHLRAALLDLNDPSKVLARTETIMEPETSYEREGIVPNVVFPCGSVVSNGTLFVYYGGADKVTGVATMPISELIEKFKHEK